jgi:hypothetical protein
MLKMATKQATFDVPDKEPWKDKETLQGLYHHDELNQSEIADYFIERGYDVTASTISYWMGKLEVDTTHTSHGDDEEEKKSRKCVNYDECGNETPGVKNGMCVSCLDEARQKQRTRRKEIQNEQSKSY